MAIDTTVESTEHTASGSLFKGWTGNAWAFLLLRLWIALNWILQGLHKFESGGTFSVENHKENMTRLAEGMAGASPLLAEWMTKLYTAGLGYEQLLLGVLLLLGVKMRVMLALSGLMFVSLSFGLMSVSSESSDIIPLGMYLLLNAVALMLLRHQKLVLWRDKPCAC